MAKKMKNEELDQFDVLSLFGPEDRQRYLDNVIKNYSLLAGANETIPPVPEMHRDGNMWVPDNPATFVEKHKEEWQKVRDERAAKSRRCGVRQPGRSVQPVNWYTTTPDAPKEGSVTSSQEQSEEEVKSEEVSSSSEEAKEEIKEILVENEPEVPVVHSQEKHSTQKAISIVEQSPKTRQTCKKIDAAFDVIQREILHVTSLKEKKPVFLPLELRDSIDQIASLSDDRNVTASHVVINILSKWIENNRELINAKLARKKIGI